MWPKPFDLSPDNFGRTCAGFRLRATRTFRNTEYMGKDWCLSAQEYSVLRTKYSVIRTV